MILKLLNIIIKLILLPISNPNPDPDVEDDEEINPAVRTEHALP